MIEGRTVRKVAGSVCELMQHVQQLRHATIDDLACVLVLRATCMVVPSRAIYAVHATPVVEQSTHEREMRVASHSVTTQASGRVTRTQRSCAS